MNDDIYKSYAADSNFLEGYSTCISRCILYTVLQTFL